MKSLKQVWSRNLPPPVAESGRRRLGTARSAFGATMRVSRVGSPMFPYCSKEKAVSEQDAKHPTIETGLILQSWILAAKQYKQGE